MVLQLPGSVQVRPVRNRQPQRPVERQGARQVGGHETQVIEGQWHSVILYSIQ